MTTAYDERAAAAPPGVTPQNRKPEVKTEDAAVGRASSSAAKEEQ
jgi:hypothetical protein